MGIQLKVSFICDLKAGQTQLPIRIKLQIQP